MTSSAAPPEGGNRALILDAARAELAEHGYEGATVRSIARRAGVDARLIRHYFRGKPQLIREAIGFDSIVEQLRRGVRGAAGGPADGRRLYELATRFWRRDPRLWRALIACGLSTDPQAREAVTALVGELTEGLVGRPPGTPPTGAAAADLTETQLRAELVLGQLLGLWVTMEEQPAGDGQPAETSVDLPAAVAGGVAVLLGQRPGRGGAPVGSVGA